MSRILMRAAALGGIYLLVLSSLKLGDIAFALLFGLAVASVLRPEGASPTMDRGGAVVQIALASAAEITRGSWRVVRFCLGRDGAPGFVEIPRDGRSEHNVAMWGVLTGLAPDEVPVDVDRDRDVLIVHLVDAADPDAVRARHARDYERLHSRVMP